MISTDATFLVKAATEFFVQYLAGKAYETMVKDKRKKLRKQDILNSVLPQTNLEFLESNHAPDSMDASVNGDSDDNVDDIDSDTEGKNEAAIDGEGIQNQPADSAMDTTVDGVAAS